MTDREKIEEEFNRFLDEKEGVPRMWHSDEQMEWGMDIAHHFAEWQKQRLNTHLKTSFDMTKEEKELANDITEHGGKWVSDREVYEGCIEIVTWKEQQMIEKAVKWINIHMLYNASESYKKEIIENFKKYMEEN